MPYKRLKPQESNITRGDLERAIKKSCADIIHSLSIDHLSLLFSIEELDVKDYITGEEKGIEVLITLKENYDKHV